MNTMPLADAQIRLPEIVHRLAAGEEVTLIDDGQVVARIVGERHVPWQRPGPGLGKGMFTIADDFDEPTDPPPVSSPRGKAGCYRKNIWMAPDFDAPLEDFREYMS